MTPKEQESIPSSHEPSRDERIEELRQIIEAYNEVMEKLESSHETLTAEVRRLQDELASANAALQRGKRLSALGEMAAGIAHEIRNPLASIQLYAGMLCEDLEQQPVQFDIANKIVGAVRGLNGIVTDVLVFSREMRIRPVTLSPSMLFHRVVDEARPLLETHGVSCCFDTEDESEFQGDRELLHQALLNLVRNAAEAVRGINQPKVQLSAEKQDRFMKLVIADNGPGIPEATVDRIFNPFFTTRETGTGLGLAIVTRIVDAHGGTIDVENKDGAIFTLRLPLEMRLKEQEEAMYTVDF